MAMHTTANHRAGTAMPFENNDTEAGVSTRRLKKREVDRKCQRQARERTKTRIAYLEGLLEDFRRQDSSGQLATLMKQLKEVETERNVMAKALKDIQKAMDTHKPLNATSESERDNDFVTHNTRKVFDAVKVERESSSISPSAVNISPPLGSESTASSERRTSSRNFDLAQFTPDSSLPLQDQDQFFAPEVVPLQADGQVLVKTRDLKEPHPMPCNYSENWNARRQSCSCNSCHNRQPGRRSIWQGNYWRYANEVLSERFEWRETVVPESDAMCDDVPIRALLEGWDAVASRGPLHPSWQILRRIDETLFFMCAPVERLAIMRAMHILLQFHTESTSERYTRLPPWYMRRPSQTIAHSYAIDYFAWPGVRERFIFGEHDYCGNDFWTLFTTSFKLLWPYEFRDCYTKELDTGLYHVSPMFDQRLADIKCWTMGPDIFRRFPELQSDMPTFNSIPQNPSTVHARLYALMQGRKLLPAGTSPTATGTSDTSQAKGDEEAINSSSGSQHGLADSLHVRVTQMSRRRESRPGSQLYVVPETHRPSAMDLNPLTTSDSFRYEGWNAMYNTHMYQGSTVDGFPRAVF